MWKALILLHRLCQCRLEPVPVWINRECSIPRLYGASMRGTRKYGTQGIYIGLYPGFDS